MDMGETPVGRISTRGYNASPGFINAFVQLWLPGRIGHHALHLPIIRTVWKREGESMSLCSQIRCGVSGHLSFPYRSYDWQVVTHGDQSDPAAITAQTRDKAR